MTIRSADMNDAEAMLAIYAPYIENTAITFETALPSINDFRERIKTYTAKYPWLIAEEEGTIIGYAYASKHRDREAYQWCVESSVYVLEAYHSKGVAAELYSRLFSMLQASGYVNVYAGITQPNDKSNKFHIKMGFEPVGVYKKIGFKLGRWHDVAWMLKVVNEHFDSPACPGNNMA